MSKELEPGEARSSGPSVRDYLDREKRDVTPHLREASYAYMGSEDIGRERYYAPEFFALEVERMWRRTWQMACRLEDIPEVGDFCVYDIVDDSLLVVRAGPDEIRAYFNACLHRGRMLKTQDGRATELRCPFHGFTWNLDGSLADVPCRWDFPHIESAEFRLPEAKVGTWGGFVFVNMDPEAASLEEYLGPIPAHFEAWNMTERYKSVHVGKVIHANWKICAEAFMEAFHSIATHPQILPYTGDANTQYDVYPEHPHVNRMLTPFATPSPHLSDVSEEKIAQAMMPGAEIAIPEGKTAREVLAEIMRGAIGGQSGWDLSGVSDSEVLDALQYYVFPNFSPWGGYLQNLVYRWRPNGDDPNSCLMEVMMLTPVPKDAPCPPAAKLHLLDPETKWSEAEELGPLGAIFDQDMGNLSWVQKGIRAARKPGVTLGNYQEIRIRQMHATLDRYLAGSI
jgi:phenylpropionate dioxygenase-like ring-hydroxylating dioxygenase large terminal subunit